MASTSPTLAVLIDADNAQPSVVDGLLAEIAKYGTATVKRIYGDWTGPQLKGWKETLLTHAIQPIQQFRYTTGKNATDSALIIDAMDLLYTGRLGGFCIVLLRLWIVVSCVVYLLPVKPIRNRTPVEKITTKNS